MKYDLPARAILGFSLSVLWLYLKKIVFQVFIPFFLEQEASTCTVKNCMQLTIIKVSLAVQVIMCCSELYSCVYVCVSREHAVFQDAPPLLGLLIPSPTNSVQIKYLLALTGNWITCFHLRIVSSVPQPSFVYLFHSLKLSTRLPSKGALSI